MPPDSIYAVLHRECVNLFPDEMFADLFTDVGRRSVPPMIVSVVMVLQRIEGCSDREAVDPVRLRRPVEVRGGRVGLSGVRARGAGDMRARLAASARPNRIFEVTLEAARAAGLVGRKRVLDSTPLYDAVATMDTVTLIRSAIRGLLRAAAAGLEGDLEGALRGLLRRDDDYAAAGKPVCDWDDRAARGALVDALARDARALLGALDGRELGPGLSQAAALLATVVGQDLDEDADGVFRIARRVAKDRVISTVDPDARHGHKTSARGFDGYKGHVAIDPDSEIITATTATAGNTGDAEAAHDLLVQDLPTPEDTGDAAGTDTDPAADGQAAADGAAAESGGRVGTGEETDEDEPLAVYGDAAYGAGDLLDELEKAGVDINTKVQPPHAPGGRFGKDRFAIDLGAGTVTCPGQVTVRIRPAKAGGGTAAFGAACAACPLAAQCTGSPDGRTITIGRYEAELTRARTRQADPAWQAGYKATRPKVERKIGHLMRRRHGGRRARVRGRPKVAADFALLAAAANAARFGVLGIIGGPSGNWMVAPN